MKLPGYDPKFGYHWIWIVPLLFIGQLYGSVKRLMKKPKVWTEEQKRLQVLAGIRENE